MSMLSEVARALRPMVQARTIQGRPISVGERQFIPLARSYLVGIGRPDGPLAAGLAWCRPLALLEARQGQIRRIPIPSPMRRITLALLASGLLLVITGSLLCRRSGIHARRSSDE